MGILLLIEISNLFTSVICLILID